MAVLAFAESLTGSIKKAGLEAVAYGHRVAQALGTECIALTIGTPEGASTLGQYGANKVVNVDAAKDFDSQTYAAVLANAAKQLGCDVVVFSHSTSGKSLAGRVAVRLDAGLVSAAISAPSTDGGFQVKKSVFSGKGFATYNITTANKVLTVAGNTFRPEVVGSDVAVENITVEAPAGRVRVKETSTVSGTVPLPEAELVVSAGRGMKGPENWGIIEEMAGILGATTACSRPVADIHWRPHHEHVGQTGVAIRPTLYIAIGISGAIQHLAGVNQSKVIVVINKDPEAPFFKAADYGVVGDLFDVVPRLNEALKKFKASNN
ncbi:MAG: electron transfer flavoprotein subunit alpha/FixB family protein [Aureispira sp.]|nr:electron transfer flavoprotein subunit alpha/FixB family protein [Aureispira sp.]